MEELNKLRHKIRGIQIFCLYPLYIRDVNYVLNIAVMDVVHEPEDLTPSRIMKLTQDQSRDWTGKSARFKAPPRHTPPTEWIMLVLELLAGRAWFHAALPHPLVLND